MSPTLQFAQAAMQLQPLDTVAVALQDLSTGTVLLSAPGMAGPAPEDLVLRSDIPRGHRFALQEIPAAELLRQYGQPFGTSKGILRGTRIDHSVMSDEIPLVRDLAEDLHNPETPKLAVEERATFQGYLRPDGRYGTRNWVLVVPTSMCASHEASQIAMRAELIHWTAERFPDVDGVVAIPHSRGCGTPDGRNIDSILRTLTAYASHPNVGAVLFLELGCEKTGQDLLRGHMDKLGLLNHDGSEVSGRAAAWISIQKAGGTMPTIQQGLEEIQALLPFANQARRQEVCISELILGVECGGSDSFSGISANPSLGHAADLLVQSGGTVVLSEVPEFCGAEHVLAQRSRNHVVGCEVYQMVDWYRGHAARLGAELGQNPSPGNRRGGLLNITLKSLGAIAKGGTTRIEGTMDYAAPPPCHGLNLMQGPGYDQESTPGLIASGATVVVFTTGRGTTIGNAIAPVIKLATNTEIHQRMASDLDLSAGGVLDGTETLEQVGQRVYQNVQEVASGQLSKSEENGHREFQIWAPDALSL
jgi:arabinonate dehydratase